MKSEKPRTVSGGRHSQRVAALNASNSGRAASATQDEAPLSKQSGSVANQNKCSNCGVLNSPVWRRGLNREKLCNACGLYFKSHRAQRGGGPKKRPVARSKSVLPPLTAGTSKKSVKAPAQVQTRSPSIQLPVVNWPAPPSPLPAPPPPPMHQQQAEEPYYPIYSPDYTSQNSFGSLSPALSLQLQHFDSQFHQQYPGEYFEGSDEYSDPSPPGWSSPDTPSAYGGITLPSLVTPEYPAPLDMTCGGHDLIDIPTLPSLDMYLPDQASYLNYY